MPGATTNSLAKEAAKYHGRVFEETRLLEWLRRTGNSFRTTAKACGCSYGQFQRIAYGTALPNLVHATAIEIVTDGVVPCSYWLTTKLGKAAWEALGQAVKK